MERYIDKIKKSSERILKEKKVEIIIGYRKGTVPLKNKPFIIKRHEDVKDLTWDKNCRMNLAAYLPNRKEKKIGIIAKGCDSRNIVTHIVENKIKRDQLYVIGVPCTSMADKNNPDKMADNCYICKHRNPVIYDELVADEVAEQKEIDPYENVRKIEKMKAEEKWKFFADLLEPCNRCYACRNACPLCYCPTCFVDESKPQWVGTSINPVDVRTFHFLRAYHCAGRCTDCGACEAACPQNIKMRHFTKKLEKDCFEQFGWEAGLSLDEHPPLETFKVDDPQEFIK